MAKVRFLTFYLLRNYLKENYTIGNLYCTGTEFDGKNTRIIENQFLCNILEDKFRGNDLSKKKVPGETCIPEGNYEIKMTYSPSFKKELPKLLNVSFFDGIFIHAGNTPLDSRGCLLTGMNKEIGKVLDSKIWLDVVITKIKQYDKANIIIRNNV